MGGRGVQQKREGGGWKGVRSKVNSECYFSEIVCTQLSSFPLEEKEKKKKHRPFLFLSIGFSLFDVCFVFFSSFCLLIPLFSFSSPVFLYCVSFFRVRSKTFLQSAFSAPAFLTLFCRFALFLCVWPNSFPVFDNGRYWMELRNLFAEKYFLCWQKDSRGELEEGGNFRWWYWWWCFSISHLAI